MKIILNSLVLIISFALLVGCEKVSTCDDVLCFTPPPKLYIKLIDKNSGEDLLVQDNDIYNYVSLIGSEHEDVEVRIVKENDEKLIDISDITWLLGFHKYKLKISEELILEIDIEMEEKYSNCCTFFSVLHFDIQNFEFAYSIHSEIINVKI